MNCLKSTSALKKINILLLCNLVSVLLKADVMKCNLLRINNKEVCLLSLVCKKVKEVTCKIMAQSTA
jgi:hypothetical protein